MAYNSPTNTRKWLTKTILSLESTRYSNETIEWQFYKNWSYLVGLAGEIKYKIGPHDERLWSNGPHRFAIWCLGLRALRPSCGCTAQSIGCCGSRAQWARCYFSHPPASVAAAARHLLPPRSGQARSSSCRRGVRRESAENWVNRSRGLRSCHLWRIFVG